jgi:hypothetical protein
MDLLENHFSNISGNLYNYDNTYEMFSYRGKANHLNYLTFIELFKNMITIKEPQILETGIASAGTQSTYLFNEYIKKYGGRLWSVDTNQELIDKNKGNMCHGTTLICDDSINFLKYWVENSDRKADVVYLDSYDLDWYNYHHSALHCLNEYLTLIPALQKGTLLLIDDTPKNPYWLDTRGQLYYDMVEFYNKNNLLPGKGMYVLNTTKNVNILLHQYQILYKYI